VVLAAQLAQGPVLVLAVVDKLEVAPELCMVVLNTVAILQEQHQELDKLCIST
jgi:hypothetical protein